MTLKKIVIIARLRKLQTVHMHQVPVSLKVCIYYHIHWHCITRHNISYQYVSLTFKGYNNSYIGIIKIVSGKCILRDEENL